MKGTRRTNILIFIHNSYNSCFYITLFIYAEFLDSSDDALQLLCTVGGKKFRTVYLCQIHHSARFHPGIRVEQRGSVQMLAFLWRSSSSSCAWGCRWHRGNTKASASTPDKVIVIKHRHKLKGHTFVTPL